MNIETHPKINQDLCGTPEVLEKGLAILHLQTTEAMVSDEKGLVHGGFLFGLADYAAMLCINHPHVVLGESTCRFLKPVVLGDRIKAEALLASSKGKKHVVSVTLFVENAMVFSGTFTCFIPKKHVLE